ncbi:hypothetical protein AB0H83_33185 [Dactylosporangium sp. NPDC050688]|uniref:hypothetical protein n=1 Tax=Dactylosporangium sp. NPDC050688 TaxID=3157217 RepID=UPI0033D0FE83
MASAQGDRRPGVAARRFGYAVSVSVNLVIMYVLNVSPGWQAASILTGTTTQVLGMVNLSLLAGVVVNVVYVVADGPLVRRLGDLATTAISMVALVRVWQVFPFDFAGSAVDWGIVTRSVLVAALAGTGIAVLVHVVALTLLMIERLAHVGTDRHALR